MFWFFVRMSGLAYRLPIIHYYNMMKYNIIQHNTALKIIERDRVRESGMAQG